MPMDLSPELNAQISHWRCPKGHWNEISRLECRYCGATYNQATAVRLDNKLTPQQVDFYKTTMPSLLRVVQSMESTLQDILAAIKRLEE